MILILALFFNRRNFLELTVYFQELNHHLIEQKEAYKTESLLGMWTGKFWIRILSKTTEE